MRVWIAIVGLSLALGTGCMANRTQINIADLETRATAVKPGSTTVTQLEEILGGPATSITPIGKKLLYVYTFGEAKTMGLSAIILNISRTNSAIDTALFLVDENEVVEWMKVGTNSSKVEWQWWAFGD